MHLRIFLLFRNKSVARIEYIVLNNFKCNKKNYLC